MSSFQILGKNPIHSYRYEKGARGQRYPTAAFVRRVYGGKKKKKVQKKKKTSVCPELDRTGEGRGDKRASRKKKRKETYSLKKRLS